MHSSTQPNLKMNVLFNFFFLIMNHMQNRMRWFDARTEVGLPWKKWRLKSLEMPQKAAKNAPKCLKFWIFFCHGEPVTGAPTQGGGSEGAAPRGGGQRSGPRPPCLSAPGGALATTAGPGSAWSAAQTPSCDPGGVGAVSSPLFRIFELS